MEFWLAAPVPFTYNYLFHELGHASVAQRQSTGFVNQKLWVQIPPLASYERYFVPSTKTILNVDNSRVIFGAVAGSVSITKGSWPSGQWHQTVNLATAPGQELLDPYHY